MTEREQAGMIFQAVDLKQPKHNEKTGRLRKKWTRCGGFGKAGVLNSQTEVGYTSGSKYDVCVKQEDLTTDLRASVRLWVTWALAPAVC
jgi:hypothetical protein